MNNPDRRYDKSWIPSLQDMKVFMTISEAETITSGSIQLHISQSQASRIVRKLERSLGVALFRRNSKGIHLTGEGALFHETCTKILKYTATEMRSLQNHYSGEYGEVTVSVLPSMAYEHLAQWATAFKETFPNSTFNVFDAVSHDALEAVRTGRADTAIASCGLERPDGRVHPLFSDLTEFQIDDLFSEDFFFIESSARTRGDQPTWAEALSRGTVGFNRNSSVSQCLSIISRLEGFDYNPVTLTSNPLVLSGFVESGLGVSVVPDTNLQIMANRGISAYRLGSYRRVVSVVSRRGRKTPLVNSFISTVVKTFNPDSTLD